MAATDKFQELEARILELENTVAKLVKAKKVVEAPRPKPSQEKE